MEISEKKERKEIKQINKEIKKKILKKNPMKNMYLHLNNNKKIQLVRACICHSVTGD